MDAGRYSSWNLWYVYQNAKNLARLKSKYDMAKLVVDIETIGFDFDSFDPKSQKYLLKFSETKEEREEAVKRLNLYPLTGEVATIGLLNPETMKGQILFQDKGEGIAKFEEGGFSFEVGTEKEILDKFWKVVKNYDQIITFNGRSFDIPYLMIRSAVNHVKVSRNLMGYRYNPKTHCDLMEQLTFYGATRKYSLDFYAKSFGIKSSKDEGIDGSMVHDLYKKKKYLEVARYCARDLVATKELYEYWKNYLKF